MNCSPFVIGVAGGTGSGKTTLATKLEKAIPNDSIILSHDFYYRDNRNIPYEERTKLNYDHPNAFETNLLIEDIKKLKSGYAIDHPEYSFVTHTRTSSTVHMEPTQVIIVEGILIFEAEYMDGLRHGKFNKYYEDGKPYLQETFAFDTLEGEKRKFERDGSFTVLNYEGGEIVR